MNRRELLAPSHKWVWLRSGATGIVLAGSLLVAAEADFSPPARWASKDGAEMVLIPAGTFAMGSNRDDLPKVAEWMRKLQFPHRQDLTEKAFEDETPRHHVHVDSFYIDKHEVTNAQYRKFVEATGHREPQGMAVVKIDGKFVTEPNFRPWADPNFNHPNQPVVCVELEDAKAYAAWAGKRLPTEAEWEKAARGGRTAQEYAWGDDWPPQSQVGNFAEEAFKKVYTEDRFPSFPGYDDGFAYVAPVGTFRPNGYGLFDMMGNAAEWVGDYYGSDYYAASPLKNPRGPESGEKGITRGGSWFYKWAYITRVATPGSPSGRAERDGGGASMLDSDASWMSGTALPSQPPSSSRVRSLRPAKT